MGDLHTLVVNRRWEIKVSGTADISNDLHRLAKDISHAQDLYAQNRSMSQSG